MVLPTEPRLPWRNISWGEARTGEKETRQHNQTNGWTIVWYDHLSIYSFIIFSLTNVCHRILGLFKKTPLSNNARLHWRFLRHILSCYQSYWLWLYSQRSLDWAWHSPCKEHFFTARLMFRDGRILNRRKKAYLAVVKGGSHDTYLKEWNTILKIF